MQYGNPSDSLASCQHYVLCVEGDKRKGRKENERNGMLHKITERYISAICLADSPTLNSLSYCIVSWADFRKNWRACCTIAVAPYDTIKLSKFCVKNFRVFFTVFRSTYGVKIPVFLLISWSSLQQYNCAALMRSLWLWCDDQLNRTIGAYKTILTPVCDCGMDYESVEHFLLELQIIL